MSELNKDNFGVLEYNYGFYDRDKSLEDVYMISMTFTYRGIVQHFIKREEDTDIGFIKGVLSVINTTNIDYLFIHFLKGFVDLLKNIVNDTTADVSCMTPIRDPKINISKGCEILPFKPQQYKYNVKLFNNIECMDMLSYVHNIKPLESGTLNCIVKMVLGKKLLNNREYKRSELNLIEGPYINSANEVSDALLQMEVINKLLTYNNEQLIFDKKQLSNILIQYINLKDEEKDYKIMYVFKYNKIIITNHTQNLKYSEKGVISVIKHSVKNILENNISFKDTTIYVKDECSLEDAELLFILGIKRFVYTYVTGCGKGIKYLKDNDIEVTNIHRDQLCKD